MTSLSLHIPETFDLKTLKIDDNSIYDLAPVNGILEIRTPSSPSFIIFYQPLNWKSKVFDCELLNLCYPGCSPIKATLPDGIYDVRYSVDPNLLTMVEFLHFRTTSIMKRLAAAVCSFFNKKADYKKSEYKTLMDKLIEIKFVIDAAKYKAEECLEKKEALELYDTAVELLNQFDNGPCCS